MRRGAFAAAIVGLAATLVRAQYGPDEVPQPPASAPQRPEAVAVQERPGHVTSVDRDSGRIVVTTSDGPFTLYLPAQQASGLQQGEEVTLRIGLLPGPKGTETKGAGSFATDPETGSPAGRPPGAER